VTDLIDALALLCTAAGLIAGLAVLGTSRDGVFALRVALDLWTAAGLLRLAGPPTWQRLAAAAAIPALRQLLSLNLQASHSSRGRPPAPRRSLRPAWTRARR